MKLSWSESLGTNLLGFRSLFDMDAHYIQIYGVLVGDAILHNQPSLLVYVKPTMINFYCRFLTSISENDSGSQKLAMKVINSLLVSVGGSNWCRYVITDLWLEPTVILSYNCRLLVTIIVAQPFPCSPYIVYVAAILHQNVHKGLRF